MKAILQEGIRKACLRRDVVSATGRETLQGTDNFKLKDSVGTKTNGYKLSMNKLSLDIRKRFLTTRATTFWNSSAMQVIELKKT